jgi:hypothetical protein
MIKDTFWTGHGEISGTYWSRLKHDASKRELEFDMSIEDGWNLFLKQGRKCALSGVSIKFAKMTNDYWRRGTTASLDRIDSSVGYVSGNVQWVHKTVNKMKQNIPESELLKWCRLLIQHSEKEHERTI